MKRPTKIYYNLATGDKILYIGESEGGVRETTIDEDFISYSDLSNFSKEVVGMIRLEWGQHADKFGIYAYHIDLVTKEVVFDPTPIQIIEHEAEVTLLEQIEQLKADNAILKESQSSANQTILGMMDMLMFPM